VGEGLQISYTGAGNVTPPDTTPKGFVGTIEDATGLDGCKWLIKLDNGTRLEPIGLESAYQKAGLKVRVEYTQPETDIASTCMAGQIVKLTKIEVVETGAGLKSCEDARTAFKKVTDELDAAPKACLTDADCVSFGYDPTSGCPQHKFTAKKSFDPRAADHTAAVDGLRKQCPMPEFMCAQFAASKPHCDGATKQCRGTH